MALIEKTTHVVEAQDNLISQFADKTNLDGMIDAYVEQVQIVERVLFDLLEDRGLASAVGEQLDVLGRLIKQPREGRNDANYRAALSARVGLNLGSGTMENVISMLKSVAGPIQINMTEFFPASFEAELGVPIDPLSLDMPRIATLMSDARGAGIKGILRFFQVNPFQFDTGLGYDQGHYGDALEG